MKSFRFQNLTLRTRFTLGIMLALVPFALLLTGGVILAYLPAFDVMREIAEEFRGESEAVHHLQVQLLRAAMPPNDYLIHADPAEQALFERRSRQVEAAYAQALRHPMAREQHAAVEKSRGLWRRARALGAEILRNLEPAGDPRAVAAMERFDALIYEAEAVLDRVHAHAHADVGEALVRAEHLRGRGIVTFGVVLAIGVIMALAAGVTLWRSILRPLGRLTEGARAFAGGDYSYRVELDAQDELGELARVLNEMAERIERDRAVLQALALRDPLTDLYNRRAFDDRLDKLFELARRHGRELSLVLIDIDHFKSINDTHGHQAGDRVLQDTARRIQGGVRASDHVARFGGEEIAVLLPETNEADAVKLAEKIRTDIESTGFVTGDGERLHVTVSCGVAGQEPDVPDATALAARADEALYAAKRRGRNCTCRYAEVAAPG